VHASLVQDGLPSVNYSPASLRGLFRAPFGNAANMLQPLRSSIYAFKTDFVVASWIARLKAERARMRARNELASAGFSNRRSVGFDDQPLGYARSQWADRCADGRRAPQCRRRRLSRAAPMIRILFRADAGAGDGEGSRASDPHRCWSRWTDRIVLAAPFLQEGASSLAGFVIFSYELAPLMLGMRFYRYSRLC